MPGKSSRERPILLAARSGQEEPKPDHRVPLCVSPSVCASFSAPLLSSGVMLMGFHRFVRRLVGR